MTPHWSNEAWESLKAGDRTMHGAELRDKALCARLKSSIEPRLHLVI